MINDNTAKWKVRKLTDYKVGSEGYWQPNEEVKVGTIRFPQGEDNIGYVLECVGAGTTGEEQPTLLGEELANYAEVGRVGQVRVIFNLAEKDVDEVMAMGITYSRLTYPELWDWAGKRAGLIISEEEWQAKFAETNGKFVPYYSSGDGSSTFRTPLLGAYLKGAENSADVGKYVDDGLPNITGDFLHYMNGSYSFGAESIATGAFTKTQIANRQALTNSSGAYSTCALGFDASRCSSIYGNSDTVTPETMTGIWVIKAVGVVVDSGETDLAQVLQGVEQVQNNLTATNNKITGISDYSVESYRNGTEWYEVYKSGKVRQGGFISSSLGSDGYQYPNLHLPFKDTNYSLYGNCRVTGNIGALQLTPYSTTTFQAYQYSTGGNSAIKGFMWVAEGQGA